MLKKWQNWCRLCAKKDFEDSNTLYKTEAIRNQMNIVNLINKYFMLSLHSDDGAPTAICDECSIFLTKVDDFKEHCTKVDQMFNELILNNKDVSAEDLQSIRCKFGVDSEDVKFSLQQLNEEMKEDVPDEFPDPLDTSFEEDVAVKEEQPETEVVSSKRRRGRPRKLKPEEEESTTVPEREEVTQDTEEKPKQHKKRGRKPLEKICKICSKAFTRFDSLRNHLMIVHHQSEMPFVCSKCPKRFVKISSLKIHERSHLPDDERLTSICPMCDKKFSTKGSVKIHLNSVHTNEKIFMCEDCGKSFKTKTALNEHRIVHSNEHPFHCTYCPKKFKNLPAKKLHEETHTETKFECPTCGLKLNTRRTLRLHMVVHSDKRKYKCNYCGNDYKRAKTLKDHLLLHTGQRPHECPFCEKTFTTGSNCRSHKKKEHPTELAALEASGKQSITNLPKLHDLQSKFATSMTEGIESKNGKNK